MDVVVLSRLYISINGPYLIFDISLHVEKIKRKVEGDLKLTQEAVSDLERIKSELAQTVQRKEKELCSMSAKIEDEQTLGSKYSRQIKELQTRLEEVDEELLGESVRRAQV